MITFTEAQIMAWLSPVLWPFLRVLALFTAAPVFSMRAIPVRVRIGLAFFVALCAQAVLPDQPVIDLNGREALGAVLQQVGVGLALGFAVRLVFVAVELAGEVIGLQMGLNFASFFDPMANAQVSAVGCSPPDTCATFTCPGGCACVPTTEGTTVCIVPTCVAPCTTTADCPPGTVCFTLGCCGPATYCVPIAPAGTSCGPSPDKAWKKK